MPTETRDHRDPDHEDVFVDHRKTLIEHVFVLMMENRSFDHMLGLSGITGTDAATGKPTAIAGLTGEESNTFQGHTFRPRPGAKDVAPWGPGHEFHDVLIQMCGAGTEYRGGHYPRVDNSGYVASYASRAGNDHAGEVMRCFTPETLPILTALAKEFCVCDHWFSSMPGPTWPNRMFAHAGTSGFFDDAPPNWQEGAAQGPYSGFTFSHGTIFSRLSNARLPWRIYADDPFPNVGELAEIEPWDIREVDDLAEDLRDPHYNAAYTWIEPSYDVIDNFRDGNSQHPLGSVAAGEALIKKVYEAIRASPVWKTSMLVITYDEHGGFYDHVIPRTAMATGSTGKFHGFNFKQLGPRVPTVVVSPLVAKNLIEHRPFDHAAIPALVERVFGLDAMTMRDGRGNAPNHLAHLPAARTDTPRTLPAVAAPPRPTLATKVLARPTAPIPSDPDGNLHALLRTVVRHDLALHPERRAQIIAHAETIKTRGQLLAYMKQVQPQAHARKVELGKARAQP
jgi:phospholipase C